MPILKKYKKKLKSLMLIYRSYLITFFLPRKFYFSQKGYCPCCNKKVIFSSIDNWLRDYFLCSNCFSIPRQRALMITNEKYYPNWRELNIHESSPSECSISMKLQSQCVKYVSSQYYPEKPYGSIINGFRNEDLENQTFKNEIFDIVITQDVMEHIYQPDKAFKEIARTLKKGGAHIFTVPIINKHKKTEVWATRGVNSEPEFIKNPEYHKNPVDPKGSPVTMHWGFDIVDFIKENSGLETTIEYINDLNYGIRAEYIEVLVSIKK